MFKAYNCKEIVLYPPKNFISYNCTDGYKDSICVDICLKDEIEDLWSKGIKTTGCCCGHGSANLSGFIEVTDDCISKMEKMGYIHYIYAEQFGGVNRKDAFIPKSYGHIYDGYREVPLALVRDGEEELIEMSLEKGVDNE